MSAQQAQVAVVGAGISGLALGFHLQRHGIDVQVLEARERAGGNIRSEERQGYLCEWGPNGWLDNEPATARLVQALGLDDQVVRAGELANVRWIVRDGALRALPLRPPQLLSSDILTLRGKLRVLMEWAQPARRDAADESVFDFAARRIGREAAEVLVDAMVTGIYAGDSRHLSLQSAFPRMRDMEVRYGGLFKAMRAMRRERRARGEHGGGGPMGPGGTLTSFHGGLETVVHALVDKLGTRLRLATPVEGLGRSNGGWSLSLPNAELHAERVVIASPAWKAAPLLRDLDADLAREVGAIPSAPVVVVCLGFSEESLRGVEKGFGFLVPGCEELPILGTLFDTWVFPNRSQPGHVLLRTMIGGARDPNAMEETDDQLIARALAALKRLLGVTADPEMLLVVRHPRGIPQYPVGHPQTLERIDKALAPHSGLALAGNSYRGIAMNACIKEAEALAAEWASAASTDPSGARA
ncbi:MAG: protoporphyrinogen oxidase [Candidatus Latescibacterota bacterium]|nr:MAG: protoporphyrinogen oxidase [Candidatus Latescibacterota bacterium]